MFEKLEKNGEAKRIFFFQIANNNTPKMLILTSIEQQTNVE